MHVIRAKTAGFCLGVSLALNLLDKELDAFLQQTNPAGRLVTLGPIIHNPLVIDYYAGKGVTCLNSSDDVIAGDKAIIRAHGIPKYQEDHIAAQGVHISDATCPKVKKAQLAIAKYQQQHGGTLLLFGEERHPEVQGLISYATGPFIIFPSLEALEALSLTPDTHYFLAAQTTQDKREFLRIVDYLRATLTYSVHALHTICNATQERQDEVIALAKKVEAMIIVGGKNSANTRRLAQIAEEQGTLSIHVEQIEELDTQRIAHVRTIGLTAGASTPDAHINEMEQLLRNL